jgi:uroporphyrinogen decarboxylase
MANGMIGHIFENSWQVRDITGFLMDMAVNTEVSDAIFDRFTQHNLEAAVMLAKAGVDQLQTGDDVATQQAMMFGAKRWREVLKPRWRSIYAAAKAVNPDIKIWYHSDGNITEIIEDLIEIGVDILNPLQPECIDIFEMKKRYGSCLVFDGGIGTQSVMPFGTPQQVKDTVRRLKDEVGYDGALILSPTHVLEPEVPIENIVAFVEACKEE